MKTQKREWLATNFLGWELVASECDVTGQLIRAVRSKGEICISFSDWDPFTNSDQAQLLLSKYDSYCVRKDNYEEETTYSVDVDPTSCDVSRLLLAINRWGHIADYPTLEIAICETILREEGYYEN